MFTPKSSFMSALIPFDHQPRTRLVFGNGTLSRVGELVREFGGNLQASSSPEGTEFRFDLEAAPAAAEDKKDV